MSLSKLNAADSGHFPRSSGVLLSVTSLPAPYGIGDIGLVARRFIDKLAAAKQRYWQVLPLCPTGYADSPYQGLSSFAGNTNLISLDDLAANGWLTADELAAHAPFDPETIDYGIVIGWHEALLSIAYQRFETESNEASGAHQTEFAAWCQANDSWLDDFALFIALKEFYNGVPWTQWAPEEAMRTPVALDVAREKLGKRIAEHRFRQWLFARQWSALKQYAHDQGVRLIGDIPIFVGHDSCDVWVSRDLFDLNADGSPRFIAGVPPDSFSKTGQRWGNPLYLWDKHQATGYAWWINRVDAALGLFDLVRIDHFRGFDLYWQIPASDETAENGQWQPGPGRALFDALGSQRVERIIAEDLGDKLGAAIDLRDAFSLPGMIVLQFAFSGSETERERFDPKNPASNFIVYTGTHDNSTTVGWWAHTTPEERKVVASFTKHYEIKEPNWLLIRLGMSYMAHTFIVPMQDLLGLDDHARMNTPSVTSGNWSWRCTPEQLDTPLWDRLRTMTEQSNRAT
jgi:4-alpha-glucanotransferase